MELVDAFSRFDLVNAGLQTAHGLRRVAQEGVEDLAADGVITSWFGDLVMTLSVWGLWYHTLAGVRHLIWDQGVGLDLETAYKLGYAVIGGSFLLTLLTIIIV